jgi:hypothetical protein
VSPNSCGTIDLSIPGTVFQNSGIVDGGSFENLREKVLNLLKIIDLSLEPERAVQELSEVLGEEVTQTPTIYRVKLL